MIDPQFEQSFMDAYQEIITKVTEPWAQAIFLGSLEASVAQIDGGNNMIERARAEYLNQR